MRRGLHFRDSPVSQRVPRRRAQLFALGVAVTVGSGPLLGIAHLAAIAHVVCPRDGELIEARTEDLATPLPRTAPEYRSAGSLPSRSDHGHEHCPFATHSLPRSVASGGRTVATVKLDAVGAVVRPRCSPRYLTVELYRLAPKHSPPAA